MTTYKSYAECKIAHPDSEIVTTGKNWIYDKELIGTFQPRVTEGCSHAINDYSWVICNPADYCSSLKEFLESDLELVEGDSFINVNGSVETVTQWRGIIVNTKGGEKDRTRYILSAAALNGGCKIPAKDEQWSVYNNTTPLCELTDEQAAPIVDAWRTASNQLECFDVNEWFMLGSEHHIIKRGIYRIKSKSERELFIENTTKVMRDAGTKCPDNHEYFGIMFDAGARYTDNTQFFGENI